MVGECKQSKHRYSRVDHLASHLKLSPPNSLSLLVLGDLFNPPIPESFSYHAVTAIASLGLFATPIHDPALPSCRDNLNPVRSTITGCASQLNQRRRNRKNVYVYSTARSTVILIEGVAVDFRAGWWDKDTCGCRLG